MKKENYFDEFGEFLIALGKIYLEQKYIYDENENKEFVTKRIEELTEIMIKYYKKLPSPKDLYEGNDLGEYEKVIPVFLSNSEANEILIKGVFLLKD